MRKNGAWAVEIRHGNMIIGDGRGCKSRRERQDKTKTQKVHIKKTRVDKIREDKGQKREGERREEEGI